MPAHAVILPSFAMHASELGYQWCQVQGCCEGKAVMSYGYVYPPQTAKGHYRRPQESGYCDERLTEVSKYV